MIDFDGTDLIFYPPRRLSEEVKLELGGRWDKKLEAWRLPPISLNVIKLVEWYGRDILNSSPKDVKDLYETPWGFRGFSLEEKARAQYHPSWYKLYPHQREGVEWMFCNPHGAGLCALSWGLGKGAVATVTADLLKAQRVLILAPLTLAPAWIGELKRWSSNPSWRDGSDVKRATAKDREPGPGVTIANHQVIQEVVLKDEDGKVHRPDWVTNARKVKAWIQDGPTAPDKSGKKAPVRKRIVQVRRDYLAVDWDLIIVDESVLLKNRKAVKTDVLTTLRKKTDPYIFMLSGSPITKHRDDLYPQLKALLPRAFAAYWRFADFFCVVDRGGWGWTIEGDRPDHDPHVYLRDLLWVKSQDEALPELPEYIEQHIALDANTDQRKALDSMFEDWIVTLEEDPAATVVAENWLARNTRLQQITSNMGSLPKPAGGFYPSSSAKEDLLVQLIRDGEIETPLLIWTWYVATTESIYDRLEQEFPDLYTTFVVGSQTSALKDEAIQQYKDGRMDVLIMQTATGKFGHTFTDTKTVFYHDRSFDSDAYVQSLARVRRIGLNHEPVLIVPEIQDSADQLITLNLEGKLGSISRMTNADLARLLRSLKASSPQPS